MATLPVAARGGELMKDIFDAQVTDTLIIDMRSALQAAENATANAKNSTADTVRAAIAEAENSATEGQDDETEPEEWSISAGALVFFSGEDIRSFGGYTAATRNQPLSR